MNGTINLFKPKGITSHDAVSKMRKILGIRKIGHTGTLDPNATGVLPLCIGRGTRISEYLLDVDKEYIGELTLGIATDTQDIDGKVINYSTNKVNEATIYKVFNEFIGEIDQIPPMYSALKQGGKKLYELAREGKIVERPSRKVRIYDLKIYDIFDSKKIIFYVKCSRGTYIRTLCHDIGEKLGTYGYMSYLIRTGVGDFNIQHSYSLDFIRSLDKNGLKSIICPIGDSIGHIASLQVEDKYYNALINGNIIPMHNNILESYQFNKPIRIYCKNSFIGIAQIIINNHIANIKMSKVLI
ncbi:tRNA pseudouridine(55) synthase TruB [Schnuerera sp.]|uniref:tRNA pseudouridine(55) synthase TruB n=1 Tax=Schnuerera sp. TaxID=2794844 RepID=UPI002C5B6FF4|nr:tRNA pseudouridine(55) synthase TruB [Schnuerera sp.]HSH34990.1 tRNA pseudouridine(55) synthase TruB [Schnuerera sp.]